MSIPSPSPVSLWGTRGRPESAQSDQLQLPPGQEAHHRGCSEGGNSRSDSRLYRLLTSSLPLPSLTTTAGTQTDGLLPYLASSLLSLTLHQITFLNMQLDRHCMKVSKVADSLMSYTEQFMEYDPFVSATEPSNPWISDDSSFWDLEAR